MLFETNRILADQPFLQLLYKTIFATMYYGLLRVGEATSSEHVIKAENVHIAQNKRKILLVLFTSKTHGRGNKPQEVKITAIDSKLKLHFCPFQLLRTYLKLRGDYDNSREQFFIFRDKQPVLPSHVRNMLLRVLVNLNLNPKVYGTHSFHIGRSCDLIKIRLFGRSS